MAQTHSRIRQILAPPEERVNIYGSDFEESSDTSSIYNDLLDLNKDENERRRQELTQRINNATEGGAYQAGANPYAVPEKLAVADRSLQMSVEAGANAAFGGVYNAEDLGDRGEMSGKFSKGLQESDIAFGKTEGSLEISE
jgi:hypothetical protein